MLIVDEKRFYQRNLTRKGNYSLNQTAKKQELRILTNFITQIIKVYIMKKLLMTLHVEKLIKILCFTIFVLKRTIIFYDIFKAVSQLKCWFDGCKFGLL